jgi:hypothetical protein
MGEAERLRDPCPIIASPVGDGALATCTTQHRTARQSEDGLSMMAFPTRLTKVGPRSEHFNERTGMCYHQAPPVERIVAHVGDAGKQSSTSNTPLYLSWEPVMHPPYEN